MRRLDDYRLCDCRSVGGLIGNPVLCVRKINDIVKLKNIKGSCHCESVQFAVSAEVSELTTCDCSICTRKNALMIKVHESEISILKGEELLSTYTFNTNTAQHYFCSICGIYPFHRKRVTPDYFGINVYCLSDFNFQALSVRKTDGKGMS